MSNSEPEFLRFFLDKYDVENIYQEVIANPITLIVTGVIFIVVIGVLISRQFDYFTDRNTATKTNSFIKKWEPEYGASANNRKSLVDYVNMLISKKQITSAQRCLANFYIMTVNGAGIFQAGDGGSFAVASNEALSYVLRAGCRGFIFDINEPLDDKGKPFINVRDPNPNLPWKQTSMNRIPLREPMNRLRAEAFGEGSLGQTQIVQLKNTADPIFIYLRFSRQHVPAFYNAVADIIENAFKDYRLDYTWAAGRRESDFYTTDVQEFMSRVIIMSNHKAAGTRLEDIINISPISGLKDFYTSGEIKALNAEEISKIKPIIQQHVCVALDPLGTLAATNNEIDWERAHGLGIQLVGLNWFHRAGKLKEYREAFGEYSFKIKPEAMRHNVKIGAKPRQPNEDANMRGGQIRAPPLILRG